jgi:lipooligosaccharide transport system ATP-binding protein
LSVLVARGVSKRYGDHLVVDNLNLELAAGGCFGLLGPNGAGKTTTLRMVYGATPVSAGEIRVFDIDVARDPRAVKARIGVTLQDNVLIEALSPIENLRIFGRYHLLEEPELSKRVDELVDFLELGSHAHLPVVALSGGYQRRVAIAMSLMNRPELLILDEPTTGLDPAVRLTLWSRIRALRQGGATILLTTHYMDEAERLCDDVAIMDAGHVIARGSPRALIESSLAREALELECSEAERATLLSGQQEVRELRTGTRLVLYAADVDPLVERVHSLDGGARRPIIRRPTNLEDVFLRLTGTSLEGGA